VRGEVIRQLGDGREAAEVDPASLHELDETAKDLCSGHRSVVPKPNEHAHDVEIGYVAVEHDEQNLCPWLGVHDLAADRKRGRGVFATATGIFAATSGQTGSCMHVSRPRRRRKHAPLRSVNGKNAPRHICVMPSLRR